MPPGKNAGLTSDEAALNLLEGDSAAWRRYMTKPRILLVDEQPNFTRLVSLFLERTQRFEVRVENCPALALFAARGFHPDLILLDVDTAGKDGNEVSREFQADPELYGVPILFLTSLVSSAEAGEPEAMRGGMNFLVKPVNPRALLDIVNSILGGAVLTA